MDLEYNSTTFSLHGDYARPDADEKVVISTHGYSRDRHPDLKAATMQRSGSYQSQIPVGLEALDGNQSDKTSFPKTISGYIDLIRRRLIAEKWQR